LAEYKLLIKSSAAKEIEAVDSKSDRRRIIEKIGSLAMNPRHQGSEELAGYDDRHRVRQGRYRIVYLSIESPREVTIYKVGHRKDVYR